MNNVELLSTIMAAGLAIAIVAADVIIRLVILPARKDQFIAGLLDRLAGSPQEDEESLPKPTARAPDFDLKITGIGRELRSVAGECRQASL